MINIRIGVVGLWLFLCWSSLLAAAFPLSVFPIQRSLGL